MTDFFSINRSGLSATKQARRMQTLQCVGTVVGLVWFTSLNAADSPAQVDPAQDQDAESFISVFIDDPALGKDPFFPQSKRREGRAAVPTPTVTPTKVMTIEDIVEGLELKGISLGLNKPLAIINNYTFGESEERNVKIGGQVIKVRCVEILERSVTIMVNGRTRMELNLRDGL